MTNSRIVGARSLGPASVLMEACASPRVVCNTRRTISERFVAWFDSQSVPGVLTVPSEPPQISHELVEVVEKTAESPADLPCTSLIEQLELVQMPTYVAYYRVSTEKQGQSRLGLDAQREAVAKFMQGGTLLGEFTEVESGKAEKNRPEFLAAMEMCRRQKAILLIAKLDRMSRSAGYIISLLEKSPVKFVCCDQPHADITMLSMNAVFAAHERRLIGERTKAALQQVKREIAANGSRVSIRGRVFTKLGNPNLEQARAKAAAAHRTPPPPDTVAFIAKMRAEKQPLRKIVQQLNALNIRTGRGSVWYASTVRALLLQQQEGTA